MKNISLTINSSIEKILKENQNGETIELSGGETYVGINKEVGGINNNRGEY